MRAGPPCSLCHKPVAGPLAAVPEIEVAVEVEKVEWVCRPPAGHLVTGVVSLGFVGGCEKARLLGVRAGLVVVRTMGVYQS